MNRCFHHWLFLLLSSLLQVLLLPWGPEPTLGFVPTTTITKSPFSPNYSSSRRSQLSSSETTTTNNNNNADERPIRKKRKTWDEWIERLVQYKNVFGTANPSSDHYQRKKDEWAELALWAANIRRSQSRLTNEKVQQLNDLGFLFTGSREHKYELLWQDMFRRIEKYKQENGDCRVPQAYSDDPKLGRWVRLQRNLFWQRRLTSERKAKLTSIGFHFGTTTRSSRNKERGNETRSSRTRPVQDQNWDQNLARMVAYYQEYGHYRLPRRSTNTTIRSLYSWARHQQENRKLGTLTPERQEKLDQIGFPWNSQASSEDKWLANFQNFKTIFQERRYEGEVITEKVLGGKLLRWLYHQRWLYKSGTLDPKRIHLLDSIGFDWRGYDRRRKKQ